MVRDSFRKSKPIGPCIEGRLRAGSVHRTRIGRRCRRLNVAGVVSRLVRFSRRLVDPGDLENPPNVGRRVAKDHALRSAPLPARPSVAPPRSKARADVASNEAMATARN